MAAPFQVIAPSKDRFARFYAFADINRQIGERVRELTARGEVDPKAPLYTMRYQSTAMLRFEGLDALQFPLGTRPSHFTIEGDHPSRHERLYLVNDYLLPPQLVPGFGPPVELASFPLMVRDREITVYKLLMYRRASADVATTRR